MVDADGELGQQADAEQYHAIGDEEGSQHHDGHLVLPSIPNEPLDDRPQRARGTGRDKSETDPTEQVGRLGRVPAEDRPFAENTCCTIRFDPVYAVCPT